MAQRVQEWYILDTKVIFLRHFGTQRVPSVRSTRISFSHWHAALGYSSKPSAIPVPRPLGEWCYFRHSLASVENSGTRFADFHQHRVSIVNVSKGLVVGVS